MSFKSLAFVIAFFGLAVVFVHEYHGGLSGSLIQEYPFLGTFVIHVHGYVHGLRHFVDATISKLVTRQTVKPPYQEKIFSIDELAKYSGEDKSPGLYLAILGKVYDVKKGKKHYGVGGSYHVFVGRDASKSFVTGDFSEAGVSDDVQFLSLHELRSLQEWSEFYHREYEYKGKLLGRYYTETGEKTSYYKKIDELLQQAAKENEAKNVELLKYPPCNVEWSPDSGSRVWCSNKSGGIERDWNGVPRKLYKPGSDSFRCACIKLESANHNVGGTKRMGNLELYENCAPHSDSCITGN